MENIKGAFRNRHLDSKVKGRVYVALVLGALLYGSEVWSLREDLYHRLRRFRNRCARTMCRITIAHTIRHRITTKSLFAKLEIDPLDIYYNRCLLR